METFSHDLRYGIRVLIKHRSFSVVAVLALALGIGANTAIFSVINTVLLRPLPYAEPERLVEIRETNPPKHSEIVVASGSFLDWQSQNTAFEQMAAHRTTFFNLVGNDKGEGVKRPRGESGAVLQPVAE